MSAIQIDLPKTMRSLMCYGPRDYRLEEITVPRAKPGEVLVRILGAGICAGDAK
jgi:erythritol/L-threitol dehydrogenase